MQERVYKGVLWLTNPEGKRSRVKLACKGKGAEEARAELLAYARKTFPRSKPEVGGVVWVRDYELTS